MVDANLLNHYVNKEQSKLSKTDEKIHNWILNNYEHVIYSSLSQLAKAIGVGEASIVRYYNKLGYNSYVLFKMDLFNAVSSLETSSKLPFVDNIYENMLQTLNDTKSLINQLNVDEATNKIMSCKKLIIAGMGTSFTSAQDAFTKFLRVGVDCFIVSDSHLLYMYASMFDENTTLLIYSFTGETEEMVKLSRLGKNSNSFIIGITNAENSSLGRECNVILKTAGYEKNIGGGFLSSKISQTYITDVLLTSCALVDEKKTRKYSKKVTESLIY